MFLALQDTNEANKRERKTLSCVLWSQESNLTPQSTRGKSSKLAKSKSFSNWQNQSRPGYQTSQVSTTLYQNLSSYHRTRHWNAPLLAATISVSNNSLISLGTKGQQLFKADLNLAFQAEQGFFPAPKRYEPSGEVWGCHQHGALVSCGSLQVSGLLQPLHRCCCAHHKPPQFFREGNE